LNKRVYRIRLPRDKDVESFATFMGEQYFGAVDKKPTRVGAVTDLALLQRLDDDDRDGHEFFWHVGWSGLPGGHDPVVDDEDIRRRFESFDPRVEYLGYFVEYAEESA
jgi:hypothetical protein